MPHRTYQIDELTARMIAAHRICPYLLECQYFNYCNRPTYSSIKFAIRYCGESYDQCQVYKARQDECHDDTMPT